MFGLFWCSLFSCTSFSHKCQISMKGDLVAVALGCSAFTSSSKRPMSRCALWTGIRGRSRPQRRRSHGDGNVSLWSVRSTWYWCEFTENKIVPVKFAQQQNRGTRLTRCRGQTVRAGSYTYTHSLRIMTHLITSVLSCYLCRPLKLLFVCLCNEGFSTTLL